MGRPVTVPNPSFATESGNQPASQLDDNFAELQAAINDPQSYVNYGADAGAPNAYVATLNPAPSALADGLTVTIKIGAGNTNTGASTLNVNALGAKSIKIPTGGDPQAGDIVAGVQHQFVYVAATAEWILVNPALTLLNARTLNNPTLTGAETGVGGAAPSTPAAGRVARAVVTTDAWGKTISAERFVNEAGAAWELGGGGGVVIAPNSTDILSYASGVGTSGADNTAQTVLSRTIKGGRLNAVGKGLEIDILTADSSGSALAQSVIFAGATLSTGSLTTANLFRIKIHIWYVDDTHINYIREFGLPSAGGVFTDAAVASLAADQTIAITQGATAATHLTVYLLSIRYFGC